MSIYSFISIVLFIFVTIGMGSPESREFVQLPVWSDHVIKITHSLGYWPKKRQSLLLKCW